MAAQDASAKEPMTNGKASTRTKKSLIYKPPGARLITFLRGWITFVGVMALANTVQCFVQPDFVWEKLYNAPDAGATRLAARTYGMWTLLASVVRFTYAVHVYNWELYLVSLATFVIAFAHFSAEVLYYGTGLVDVGMLSPIIVSAFSIVLMLCSAPYIWPGVGDDDDDAELIDLRHFAKARKLAKQQD
jgi:Erg28 like protein